MNTQKKGKLYLIPTPISANSLDKLVTQELIKTIRQLTYFLVENIRTTRRFISSLNEDINIENLHFELIDKNTSQLEADQKCAPLLKGIDIGVMSEAGCPGIADPGNLAVIFAHQHNIRVIPLVGPSSIFMSLMASGFNGQSFVFHGYLPIDKHKRITSIKALEKDAINKKQTQIFMETPYRNNQLLEDIIKSCNADTKLCISMDISGAQEMIKTKTINNWKKSIPDLNKIPAVFLMYV
jgi:16S rRNA (cytidine1402-2'-O)-methyltransferase